MARAAAVKTKNNETTKKVVDRTVPKKAKKTKKTTHKAPVNINEIDFTNVNFSKVIIRPKTTNLRFGESLPIQCSTGANSHQRSLYISHPSFLHATPNYGIVSGRQSFAFNIKWQNLATLHLKLLEMSVAVANAADPNLDEGNETGDSEDESMLTAKEKAAIERKKRQNKKKKESKKAAKNAQKQPETARMESTTLADEGVETGTDDVEVEYVAQKPEEALGDRADDPNFAYFAKVFEAFQLGETPDAKAAEITGKAAEEAKEEKQRREPEVATKAAIVERILQQELEDAKERDSNDKLSKKKARLALQPSIAELKASCSRPDVVEWHDVTSRDPKLLVHLKSLRNTVPVPRHWCFKRKYLAGKRGFERSPFQLPDFIKRTGIEDMRAALQEKEDEKSLKSKMRERVRPKMGRIDIDYQKLHDAFFRWQTKPKMSILGEIYYEGKEFETIMREKKPGELSDDLRIALGMPIGPNAVRFPPPWLIAMQRYGPPPSYPAIKLAGLNAPIPEGCTFGYHAGGWGKPPVDEFGKPLYGDVFGLETPAQPQVNDEDEIERRHWGEMDSESEGEDESSDEEEDDTQTEAADETGIQTPGGEGFATPSGIGSSVPTGIDTPDTIELRKRKLAEEGTDTPGALFTVLPEKKVDRVAGQMMGSTHVYDIAAAQAGSRKDKVAGDAAAGVDIALNPEELDLSTADPSKLAARYEEGLRKQRGETDDQDFSDMVAEHAAKQKRKRKMQEEKKSSKGSEKKYKEFKF